MLCKDRLVGLLLQFPAEGLTYVRVSINLNKTQQIKKLGRWAVVSLGNTASWW